MDKKTRIARNKTLLLAVLNEVRDGQSFTYASWRVGERFGVSNQTVYREFVKWRSTHYDYMDYDDERWDREMAEIAR